MNKRKLTLSPRREDVREKQQPIITVDFNLEEIKEHYDSSVESIRRQFELANRLKDEGREDDQKNIYRSQIMFLESALDYYLHELNKYAMVQMFKGSWEKTERYQNFKIPMHCLEAGLKAPETSQWLLDYISKEYSRAVFTGFEYMRDLLNMLGIKLMEILQQVFPDPGNRGKPSEKGKQFIMDLYDRRNVIAHQTDRSHINAEQNDITEEYVKFCVDGVNNLVTHIHNDAKAKNLS